MGKPMKRPLKVDEDSDSESEPELNGHEPGVSYSSLCPLIYCFIHRLFLVIYFTSFSI